jgi:hypothetical protein
MPNESPVDKFVKELGLPAKTGTIKVSEGKYSFVAGATQKEIPAAFANEAELAKMVGQEVTAVASGRTIVAILTPYVPSKPWKPQCFRCYIPAPDIFKRIDLELQKVAIDKFVGEGVLTRQQAKVLLANVGPKIG